MNSFAGLSPHIILLICEGHSDRLSKYRWGEGANNFGIIATGNIDVEYDQLDAIGDMVITLKDPTSGSRFQSFQALATGAKANGALVIGQVSHPGNQLLAHIRKDVISASDIQLRKFFCTENRERAPLTIFCQLL